MMSSSQGDTNMLMEFKQTKHEISLQTTPLVGMRGLMALHVLFYHISQFTESSMLAMVTGAINASIQMPFFFLLSGFVIALRYGNTSCSLVCFLLRLWVTEPDDENQKQRSPPFSVCVNVPRTSCLFFPQVKLMLTYCCDKLYFVFTTRANLLQAGEKA